MELGEKTVEKLCNMLENSEVLGDNRCLKEVCFSGVTFKETKNLRQFFTFMEEYGRDLESLKFKKVNLNDNFIIDSMCNFLNGNVNLQYLQLSSCSFQSSQLLQISEGIKESKSLKFLDLSSNYLNVNLEDNLLK